MINRLPVLNNLQNSIKQGTLGTIEIGHSRDKRWLSTEPVQSKCMELSKSLAHNVTAGNWLGARPECKLHCYAQVVRLSPVLLTLEALRERERKGGRLACRHIHTDTHTQKEGGRTTSAVGLQARGNH